MRRNLFTIVLTIGIILASAPTIAQPAAAGPNPAKLSALQPSNFAERNKVHTRLNVAPAEPAPANPATTPDAQANSGWKYLTTLLTTLVLIGAIAVRRYSAESH